MLEKVDLSKRLSKELKHQPPEAKVPGSTPEGSAVAMGKKRKEKKQKDKKNKKKGKKK